MANGYLAGNMATPSGTAWTTATRQRPDPCGDDCTPRCPACGGLSCSCRPRFFPGQLLTDRELNGLTQYVIDKNRLHNRYLHGWGVACGLEVVCDACDSGHVTVGSGYAVAPCGDDIVVCDDQSVDVCALINSCQPSPSDCDNPYDRPVRDCSGGVTDWVLAICYDERPVRGITAQLGAGDTACNRCGCGGSGSCGCNGGGGGRRSSGCNGGCSGQSGGCGCGTGATATAPTGRNPKAQCEPTQVCEGYRFVAYPAPRATRSEIPSGLGERNDYLFAWLYANRSRFGPLIDRVLCCATKAMELRASIREGATLTGRAGLTTYVDYAQALDEFAAEFAIHHCEFVTRTRKLRDESISFRRSADGMAGNALADELSSRVQTLDETWLDIVSACLCSALLPACPEPAGTNCVPLAVVTVDNDDACRVVDICNWKERRILITWPTVTYWLSWLPWSRITKWVQNLCCSEDGGRQGYQVLALLIGALFSQRTNATPPAEPAEPMMAVPAAEEAAPAAAFAEGAGAGDEGAHVGQPAGDGKPGEEAAGDAGGRYVDPVAAAFASDDFIGHVIRDVNRLATDGPEAVGQPAWMGYASRILGGSILEPQAPAPHPEIADLKRRLDEAETTLKAQQRRITTLSRKVGKG